MIRKRALAAVATLAAAAGLVQATPAGASGANPWPVDCRPGHDCFDFVVECVFVYDGWPSHTQNADGTLTIWCDY